MAIPAIGACRKACGMLKAEITLRASSFAESHKSSNCKTRHKGTGQVLYRSRRLDAGPQALTHRAAGVPGPGGRGPGSGISL